MYRTLSKRDISPRVFQALQNLDVESLAECSEEEIRAVMPCLARMSLIGPLDQSPECALSRRMVFKILSGRETVNSIVGLLSIDFHALEVDVKKEQSLRYTIHISYYHFSVVAIQKTFIQQSKAWQPNRRFCPNSVTVT